jgi:glycosyltransferase involved in cell wall biosynthesis
VVLRLVPSHVDRVIVVDNGSTDGTAQVAKKHGVEVVTEPRAGYGRACLAGLAALEKDPPYMVAFADADGSDDLSRLHELLRPIANGQTDLVIGKRVPREPNALTRQQRFGNWLATRLIRVFWRHSYGDLGPMRAISWAALEKLVMSDPDYGWTVEMQVKAVKMGMRIREHPIPYYRRAAGKSKVSGTLTGTLKAGIKILWIIGREALRDRAFPGITP